MSYISYFHLVLFAQFDIWWLGDGWMIGRCLVEDVGMSMIVITRRAIVCIVCRVFVICSGILILKAMHYFTK